MLIIHFLISEVDDIIGVFLHIYASNFRPLSYNVPIEKKMPGNLPSDETLLKGCKKIYDGYILLWEYTFAFDDGVPFVLIFSPKRKISTDFGPKL